MEQEISILKRKLYLEILDGLSPPHGVTTRLHYLDSHFPPNKILLALEYLISNKIKGRKFLEWYQTTCLNSDLTMMAELMRVVEHEQRRRVLLAHKDLRRM